MEIAEMKRWLILAAALMLAGGGSLLVEPVIAQCSFSSRRPRKDVRQRHASIRSQRGWNGPGTALLIIA
jgi:hypothetical protein